MQLDVRGMTESEFSHCGSVRMPKPNVPVFFHSVSSVNQYVQHRSGHTHRGLDTNPLFSVQGNLSQDGGN